MRTTILCILAAALAQSRPAAGGLVLHWPFDDGPGAATAADASGSGHHGTLSNMDPATDWVADDLPPVPGGTAYALDFDAVNDVVVASGDAYKGVTGTVARTLAAWVRTTDTDGAVMNWGADVAGQKISFRTQTANGVAGAIRLEVNGGYQVGSTVVSDGTWHHVTAILPPHAAPNATHVRLYVDGELEGVSASQGQLINTAASQNFRVAADHAPQRLLGRIDDVRLYDHALDRAAIRALAGKAPDPYFAAVMADGPAAYWRLGEPRGARAFQEGALGADVDGTYANAETADYAWPGLVPASSNRCVDFSGDDDRVNIAAHADIAAGGPYTEKTLETWYSSDPFPTGTNRRVVVELGGTSHGLNHYVQLDAERYYFRGGAWHNNGTQQSHFPARIEIAPGRTYHAVTVYNDAADRFIVYLNGAPVSAKINTTIESIPGATSANGIGGMNDATRFDSATATGGGQHFDGRIDEVALYNGLLPFRRIQAHYVVGTGDRLGLASNVTLGAALNYDAERDDDGDAAFEDTIGARTGGAVAGQFEWSLAGLTDPARRAVDGWRLARVRHAYRFDGSDLATLQALENVAGNPTLQSAAFEVVFDPADFTGNEVVLELGGSTYGTSLTLDGTVLRFDVKSDAQSARAAFDLAGMPPGEAAGFLHVVGVVDLAGDRALLYVNGVLRHTAAATGDLTDWSGTDGSGLGGVNGAINFGAPGGFDGYVALVRFYPEPLDDAEVLANFQANLRGESRGGTMIIVR